MVIVTFKLHCSPGKQLEIRQSLRGISEKVKKLDGCKDTTVYQDLDNNDVLLMVEQWQHQRHLDDHMKTSLFSALIGIKRLLSKDPEIMFMDEQ